MIFAREDEIERIKEKKSLIIQRNRIGPVYSRLITLLTQFQKLITLMSEFVSFLPSLFD